MIRKGTIPSVRVNGERRVLLSDFEMHLILKARAGA